VFYTKMLGKIFKFLSKKLHGLYIFFIKHLFNVILHISKRIKLHTFQKLQGLYFKISGRLRGKHRSSFKFVKVGKVPVFTITKNVSFFMDHVYTLYGVFGIKFWLFKAN